MYVEYSYKFRLYPNRTQENQILRTLGCCRFVFNHYLAIRKEVYERDGRTFNYYDCAGDVTQTQKDSGVAARSGCDCPAILFARPGRSLPEFLSASEAGGETRLPRFKSKHDHRQSYKSKCVGTNIKVLDKAVQLPKLGLVKCRASKEVKGRILSATVSRNPSGKYFVALCCTDVEIEPLLSTGVAVGLDMGLKSFAVSSDGVEYPNHKVPNQEPGKTCPSPRQLSRKTKGSKRREKSPASGGKTP